MHVLNHINTPEAKIPANMFMNIPLTLPGMKMHSRDSVTDAVGLKKPHD